MVEIRIPENLITPFEEQCVRTCEYYQLNQFIEDAYGHEFSIVADQELGNDSTWSMYVDGELNVYDEVDVFRFAKTGHGQGIAPNLLNYLCAIGLINPGKYIIEISW